MIDKNTTAILYFSRSAQAEVEYKRWNSLQSKRQNVVFAEHLIHKALEVLENTGLPVFQYDEGIQVGATFGYRLANAFKDLYDKGYDHIITVGNDCLDLADISWDEIQASLEAQIAVLGPSLRQGAYLIGMHKEQFDFEKFARLSWHTSKLLKELVQYFEESSSLPVFLLDAKVDLNSKRDIVRLFKSLVSRNLTVFLNMIMELMGLAFKSNFAISSYALHRLESSSSRLRGPPSIQ